MTLRPLIRRLLIEGRLEDAKKKYGSGMVVGQAPPGAMGLPDHVIDYLSANDPSGNNKYLMWMAREAHEGIIVATRLGDLVQFRDGRHPDEIIKYIQDFHKKQQRLKEKDIMAYDEAEDVRDALEALPLSRKEAKAAGGEIVYDKGNVFVLYVKTHQAVCTYGSETRWCISDPGTFQNYREKDDALFYFVINRSLEGDPYHKVAVTILREEDDKWQMFDAQDDMVDSSEMDSMLGDDWDEIRAAIKQDAKTRPSFKPSPEEAINKATQEAQLERIKIINHGDSWSWELKLEIPGPSQPDRKALRRAENDIERVVLSYIPWTAWVQDSTLRQGLFIEVDSIGQRVTVVLDNDTKNTDVYDDDTFEGLRDLDKYSYDIEDKISEVLRQHGVWA